MVSFNKSLSLLIILILAVSSIIIAKPVEGQPTLSVPQFTLKYIDSNATIEITIENQNVTLKSGNFIYYVIQWKENSSEYWTTLWNSPVPASSVSDSEYTTVDFVSCPNGFGGLASFIPGSFRKIDFQVEALVGGYFNSPLSGYGLFFGENSGWSNTQTVDLTHLSLSVLSPLEGKYNTSDVALNFTVNKLVSQISYSLDCQGNITIAENITLTGLPNGAHNVTVYATDDNGYVGASNTTFFNVDVPVPTQEPEPFPTTLVMASIVTVVVLFVGLIVYFKKRKRMLNVEVKE